MCLVVPSSTLKPLFSVPLTPDLNREIPCCSYHYLFSSVTGLDVGIVDQYELQWNRSGYDLYASGPCDFGSLYQRLSY